MKRQVPLFLVTVLLAGCFQSEAPRPAVPATAGPQAAESNAPARAAIVAEPEPSLSELTTLAQVGASAEIRSEAVYAIADLGPQADAGAIGGALVDPDPRVRRAAVVALTGLEGEVPASLLATALNDADVRVRRDAAEALGEAEGPIARQALQQALNDPDEVVREIAAEMLEEPAR